MDFKELVRGFINSEVEVMTPGDMITGTLISVNDASLMLKVPPVMYGPPGMWPSCRSGRSSLSEC